jgi:hypothetical protein
MKDVQCTCAELSCTIIEFSIEWYMGTRFLLDYGYDTCTSE